MSATAFTLDDLTLDFSQEDYKPQRRDGKPGLFYEFKIMNATIKQQDKGHLAVVLDNHALDADGKTMFKKPIYLPLPVSVGQNSSPTYAKGMWLNQVRPLFPELAPYDRVEKDEITGRRIYFKGDHQLSKEEYEPAVTEANKAIGEMAKDCARVWIENGDGAVLEPFVDRVFFGTLKEDKTGKYVNIALMTPTTPANEEVCYDRKTALGG